jgi:hypothetical protein
MSNDSKKGSKAVRLVETTKDVLGEYETRWECEPPAEGVGFRVRDDEWNGDFTVRTIRRVESVGA